MVYEFSNIDSQPQSQHAGTTISGRYLRVFEFSAKFDPVPTILTQNHVKQVPDWQTTAFRKNLSPNLLSRQSFPQRWQNISMGFWRGNIHISGWARPEDPQHQVGEEDTDLNQHPNSPGYRLILNNVLFPAAKRNPARPEMRYETGYYMN